MIWPVKAPPPAGRWRRARARARVLVLLSTSLAVGAPLAGCGAAEETVPKANAVAAVVPDPPSAPKACSKAVLETLAQVVQRIYREGVASERTASAAYLITHSAPLTAAVESGNKAAARAAAKALLATGHMTNLSITRAGKAFISVGGAALAPLHGTLASASGTPLATYVASVWADEGFLVESGGITQGLIALRENGRSIAGSTPLAGALANEGTLMREHVTYGYTSLPAEAYPAGALRIYVLEPISDITPVCARSRQQTAVNTLRRVAELIYTGESGNSALKQVRRVQRNAALLTAVEHRDSQATKSAVDALLNHHIVRLRVSSHGQLLSDVGGPYVLAPVNATLSLAGHAIGSFVLSIQDDEGYLRLTRRLAGLHVLMYMGATNTATGAPAQPTLVKDSLGPMPGPPLSAVPTHGSFRYGGRSFTVFTVHAEAFPSGTLTIRVLAANPYL